MVSGRAGKHLSKCAPVPKCFRFLGTFGSVGFHGCTALWVQEIHSFFSTNITECLLCARHWSSGWGICHHNSDTLNVRMRAYIWTGLVFRTLSTLKIMYLFGFFILYCYTILFKEQFIFRKYCSTGKYMLVWSLAFFSFLFPFQDRVWPFLSTSLWANRFSFRSLDPNRIFFFIF